MASAMVKGLIARNVLNSASIACTGARDGTAENLAAETGIHLTYDWPALLNPARYVVLACKPQQLVDLPAELAVLTREKVIISILAGTPINKLKERFPEAANWIRTMPNTPGQIGAGVTAYAFDHADSSEVSKAVTRIVEALGSALPVEESQLDAVTGLSGSGPAYVFEFIAGLRDAGITNGLPEEVAYQLAVETVQGAAALLKAVPESPEQHRQWVSSPGGTTLEGLGVLDKAGFRSIINDCVSAATRRSRELAG